MNKAIGVAARLEQASPVVLVPNPPSPTPAGHRGRRIWLIAGILALVVLIASRRCLVALRHSGRHALHSHAGDARCGDASGNRDRHRQPGADDDRRILCVRRHPGALLRLQHASEADQVCAKIDPRPYQSVVDQNKANLDRQKRSWKRTRPISPIPAQLRPQRPVGADQRGLRMQLTSPRALDQAQAQIGVDEASDQQREARSRPRRSISATPISFRR